MHRNLGPLRNLEPRGRQAVVTERTRRATRGRRLAVVIPARDEEHTVGAIVRSVFSASFSDLHELSVFVVSDRSMDATEAEARSAGAVVVRTAGPQGLGAAFRVGVQTALDRNNDTFLIVDADGQYRAEKGALLLALQAEGSDLVIGNRLSARPRWMRRSRYLANRGFSRIIGACLGAPFIDTQSGFRAFNRSVAVNCLPRRDFTYTQEQYVRAMRLGFRVSGTPVAFTPRLAGDSRLVRSTMQYSANVIPATVRALTDPLP
jgi:glycosyltransferase involved in cell wall biosynthesis